MTPCNNSLVSIQPFCSWRAGKSFVASALMLPDDAGKAGLWAKREREKRGLSASDVAERINGLAREGGDPTRVSQQVLSKFEQGKGKRMPAWTRYIVPALEANDSETKEDVHLHLGATDASVDIQLLPTWVRLE